MVALDGLRLTGVIVCWFWGIAHVWYPIGFRSRVVVSFEWLWSYLTFQRGARLITGDGTDGAGAGAIADAAPVPANDPQPARRQGW